MIDTAIAPPNTGGTDDQGGEQIDFYRLICSLFAELDACISDLGFSTSGSKTGSAPRDTIKYALVRFESLHRLVGPNFRTIMHRDPDGLKFLDRVDEYLHNPQRMYNPRLLAHLAEQYQQGMIEMGIIRILKESEYPPFLFPESILEIRKRRDEL